MAKTSKETKRRKHLFGELLQKKRQALGVNQEELAWRAGIDPSYLGKIEQGRKQPGTLIFLDIASELVKLGLDLNAFIEEFEVAEHDEDEHV